MDEVSEVLNEEDETEESRCLECMVTKNELHDMDRDPKQISSCLYCKTSQAMIIAIWIVVMK
jgi:hypothetical protein